MNTREFGRTGLQVSNLVFGGGFVGGILLHADDDTRRTAMRRALEGGINWIDTAASYGQGQSEEVLGWLLQEVEQKPYISTKVGIDLDRLDDIAGQVEESLHASLARLRMESVDLFQLHNPIAPETGGTALGPEHVLGKGGAADALDRMRDQGLVRHIGFTALGEAAPIREVIDSGRFESAQVYYNLINPTAARPLPAGWSGHDFSGVLDACRAQGVAVMNIRVFAAGVLATDVRHGREIVVTEGSEMAQEEARARAVFDRLGDRHGTRAQTAIRFSLANPDVSCVVIGLAELAHLEEALAGAENGPLPDDAVADLNDLYDTEFGGL